MCARSQHAAECAPFGQTCTGYKPIVYELQELKETRYDENCQCPTDPGLQQAKSRTKLLGLVRSTAREADGGWRGGTRGVVVTAGRSAARTATATIGDGEISLVEEVELDLM